jgi:hypothetical protein
MKNLEQLNIEKDRGKSKNEKVSKLQKLKNKFSI